MGKLTQNILDRYMVSRLFSFNWLRSFIALMKIYLNFREKFFIFFFFLIPKDSSFFFFFPCYGDYWFLVAKLFILLVYAENINITIYKFKNWNLRINNLPKVTRPVSWIARIQAQSRLQNALIHLCNTTKLFQEWLQALLGPFFGVS